MDSPPHWLPALLELSDFGGVWDAFIDAVYARFCNDFVHGRVKFAGKRVSVRRHPESRGKGYGFWHCVQEGAIEEDRVPDLARCERIDWIRAVIENAGDPLVERWVNERQGERNELLWLGEEFLVVLADRGGVGGAEPYMLLKTAYYTDRGHTRRRLRAECDAYKKANAAP
jgi:hypothetical protein